VREKKMNIRLSPSKKEERKKKSSPLGGPLQKRGAGELTVDDESGGEKRVSNGEVLRR